MKLRTDRQGFIVAPSRRATAGVRQFVAITKDELVELEKTQNTQFLKLAKRVRDALIATAQQVKESKARERALIAEMEERIRKIKEG